MRVAWTTNRVRQDESRYIGLDPEAQLAVRSLLLKAVGQKRTLRLCLGYVTSQSMQFGTVVAFGFQLIEATLNEVGCCL